MSQTRPDINIHPNTRLPSQLASSSAKFDVAVLGGGPTAQTLAVRTASAGLKTLLVEAELTGGECQNWACVPSKALLRPLEILDEGARVGGVKEKKTGLVPDLPGLWKYRDGAAFGWNDDGNASGLEGLGITVVHGKGSVPGAKRVSIKGWHGGEAVEVQVENVVIATGSEPHVPDVKGLKEAGFWTPREAVSAREVPEHLIVMGTGPVGLKFATVYAQLGSKVTVLSRQNGVMLAAGEEVAKRVQKGLEDKGVKIVTNAKYQEVQRSDKNHVTITLADGTSISGSEILVAAGRSTRTVGMGLTSFGVKEGVPIPVDAHMRAKDVSDGWLYALGDTNGIQNTTHMGMYEATLCAQHIIAKAGKQIVPGTDTAPANIKDTAPQTVFTNPQVSMVGLRLAEAQKCGFTVKEVAVETGGPGTHSYLHAEDYSGWASWVIEVKTGKILGATFVGSGVANLLHASTVAVTAGLTWQQMLHAVPSFPTLSEAYNLLVQACLSTEW